jgi:hypothetical protein
MAQLGRHRGPRGAPQPELGRAGHGMQPGHQKQGGGGGASVAPSSSSDSSGDSDSGGSSSGGAIGAVNSAVFRESDSSTAALPHERNARLALDDRGSSQSGNRSGAAPRRAWPLPRGRRSNIIGYLIAP